MSRRGVTLLVASALMVVLVSVCSALRVPYVALSPGPTANTLGTINIGGKQTPLIQVEGHQTYDDGGHLNFTTVSYQGGPGHQPSLLTALRGWLSDTTAVVPEETIFPKNTSVKKVEQENIQEMTNSQQNAIVAALREANIPPEEHATIADVQKGRPADGKLQVGDEITAVDSTATKGASAVTTALRKHKPGSSVMLTVKRGAQDQRITLTTIPSPDDKSRPRIGVTLGTTFTFPFTVKISVGDVGGPSAGLMLSLGIYDKLTPGGLTGGKFIAGTGTITPDGKVGLIGGIHQKMIAARDAGATIFLTPPGNCREALRAAPKGLRLVRADTMDSAVQALRLLKSGASPSAIPACSAS